MASFNVLTEPWIPVVFADGKREDLGIYSVLANASKIRSISAHSPLEEFGIYRIMFAFLMDALQLEDSESIEELLANEQIPMDLVDEYVHKVVRDGGSFDLFDVESPFLQSPYNPQWDKKTKVVAYLRPEAATGSNHIHFDHGATGDQALTPAEAMRSLAAVNVFSTAGTHGPSSINGAPPFYLLIQRPNLFEMLCYNLVPRSGVKAPMSYDDIPPIWRASHEMRDIAPMHLVPQTSLLYGLTWPCRRVTLVPDDRGGFSTLSGDHSAVTVRSVYCQAGLKFEGHSGWKDPYVSRVKGKEGMFSSLKYREQRMIWRDLSVFIDSFSFDKEIPFVVDQYLRIRDVRQDPMSRLIAVKVYGVATNQASYLDWISDSFSVPVALIRDEAAIITLNNCLVALEKGASILRHSFGGKLKPELPYTDIVKRSKISDRALLAYYPKARAYIFDVLMSQLLDRVSQPTSSHADIVFSLHQWIDQTVKDCFEMCCAEMNRSSQQLEWQIHTTSFLLGSLYKLSRSVVEDIE